jgi:hypothetical protein
MRDAFEYTVIEQAEAIRQRIIALAMDAGENANTNDLEPEYWTVIWEIATLTTVGGLEDIAKSIQETVIPCIIETCEESEVMRNLERQYQQYQQYYQQYQTLEKNTAKTYSDGFNDSDPDLKLDSTFAANGQEDGVPPILPPRCVVGLHR